MSVFEHLMTLSSFVLALGIGTILTFVVRLYHRRREARLSAAHLLWVLTILLVQLQFWVASYTFNGVSRSSLPAIAFVIVQPILYYLQSALVSPEGDDLLDLDAYHRREGRGYMAVYGAAELLMTAYMVRIAALNPGMISMGYFVQEAITLMLVIAALVLPWRWLQIAVPAVLLIALAESFYFSSLPLTS